MRDGRHYGFAGCYRFGSIDWEWLARLELVKKKEFGMGIISSFQLGRALTALTNFYEEVGSRKAAAPIGCTGFEHYTDAQRDAVGQWANKKLAVLRKHPRHIVTQELLKNMRLSHRFGRSARFQAQANLLDALVEDGVALDLATFEASYL